MQGVHGYGRFSWEQLRYLEVAAAKCGRGSYSDISGSFGAYAVFQFMLKNHPFCLSLQVSPHFPMNICVIERHNRLRSPFLCRSLETEAVIDPYVEHNTAYKPLLAAASRFEVKFGRPRFSQWLLMACAQV